MKTSITLGIAFLVQQVSTFYGFGSCGIPAECSQEVSFSYFEGFWYVVQQDWVDRISNSQDLCAAYSYSLREDEMVSERKQSHRLFAGEEVVSGDTLYAQSEIGSHVVHTDYENYAVVVECSEYFGLFHYTSAKILSRTPSLKEAYVIQALAYLQDTCQYAADLDLLSAITVGCDMPNIYKFDPSLVTICYVSYSADTATIHWARVPYAVTAYKVEVINSEGTWEELSACPSADLARMENPSCELSVAVILKFPLQTKFRVLALGSSWNLVVPPTLLGGDKIIDLSSPKIKATGGSWTTMTFECEDQGIEGLHYELVKIYGYQCNVPSDWDSATIIGPAQKSNTFTVTTNLDYYFVACRVVTPLGRKGEVKNFIHMDQNGGTSPAIALNAQVTEASTSGVTIAWDPPADNGRSPYMSYMALYDMSSSCYYKSSKSSYTSSPATFSSSLVSGRRYAILIKYKNSDDGWWSDYSEVYLFFTLE